MLCCFDEHISVSDIELCRVDQKKERNHYKHDKKQYNDASSHLCHEASLVYNCMFFSKETSLSIVCYTPAFKKQWQKISKIKSFFRIGTFD